jgi:hypothetical protein
MFIKKNAENSVRLLKTCARPFQEGLWHYLKQNMVKHYINKEMCTVSVVFTLLTLKTVLCDGANL